MSAPGGAAADPGLLAAAELAAGQLRDGTRIGLGAGRAVAAFIERLQIRVRDGLRIQAVVASQSTEHLAARAGIRLVELDDSTPLDLTIDGADEVAPDLDLIKGWGGALVRERILSAASRRQLILVAPDKLVRRLGDRGRLPVEVIPFAIGPVTGALNRLGLAPTLRIAESGGGPLLTENGNLTIDCALPGGLPDRGAARDLERTLLAIAGVVDTGLFLGTADQVLVGYPDGRVDSLRAMAR